MWPRGLQHSRLPCPSLSRRDCSNSHPLCGWCLPVLSPCHPLLLPSIFPSIRVFSMSQLFTPGDQSIAASASVSVFLMNIQDQFPLELTGLISLLSKKLSKVFCSTTIRKVWLFGSQPSLESNSHIHTWLLENHSFNSMDLCWQVDLSAF